MLLIVQVKIHCAGRTDTAVHASHQVIHFDTLAERSGYSWVQGTNSQLPDSISLIWADKITPDFHSRFSAGARTYRYIIDNSPTRPAIMSGAVTWVKKPLDISLMQQSCNYLLGEQDFSAFRGFRLSVEFTLSQCSPSRCVSSWQFSYI